MTGKFSCQGCLTALSFRLKWSEPCLAHSWLSQSQATLSIKSGPSFSSAPALFNLALLNIWSSLMYSLRSKLNFSMKLCRSAAFVWIGFQTTYNKLYLLVILVLRCLQGVKLYLSYISWENFWRYFKLQPSLSLIQMQCHRFKMSRLLQFDICVCLG